MRLRDKVALITGAAAAVEGELMGFGGQAAHIFLREGARVVLSDIRDELGERAVGIMRESGQPWEYPPKKPWASDQRRIKNASSTCFPTKPKRKTQRCKR